MSLYDPPSDPEYCAHECPECDQPLKKEIPQARDSDWICVNPKCTRSPFYIEPFFEDAPTGCCITCGDVLYDPNTNQCDMCASAYTQEFDDYSDADPGL